MVSAFLIEEARNVASNNVTGSDNNLDKSKHMTEQLKESRFENAR